jgi:phthiocerol/phenolphthiocerol synthesis type-I polyketide synthase D
MPTSVEDIADDLIRQVQSIWPSGPYRLAGWSFGGVMAFEVARQLEARGACVESVLLLDTLCPAAAEPRKRSMREIVGFLSSHLSTLSGAQRALFLKDLMMTRLRFLSGSGNQNLEGEIEATFTPIMKATWEFAREYRPGYYRGRVVLLRRGDHEVRSGIRYETEPTLGWGKWSQGGVEIIRIPGDHMSMMEEPAVSKVAEEMLDVLNRNGSDRSKGNPTPVAGIDGRLHDSRS